LAWPSQVGDNFQVPTPFYHLSIAIDLLHHPHLQDSARRKLSSERAAFLFGNTAPDVQVISGQSRQDTHFFTLPITGASVLAWEQLFTSHPQLSQSGQLAPNRAAFIAGYVCHLQADWYWIKNIFGPNFSRSCSWGTFKSRLYLHNVLRSYLDEYVLRSLPPGLDSCLNQVRPHQWLPFARDEHLLAWSSFLAQQLHPNGKIKTVEVFAQREGSDPQEFSALLSSAERMDQEVFVHVSRNQLAQYRQELLATNLDFLNNFLA
jgi:hypothetical protein